MSIQISQARTLINFSGMSQMMIISGLFTHSAVRLCWLDCERIRLCFTNKTKSITKAEIPGLNGTTVESMIASL